jgi:8-oxo-dGTP diphosphatase
MWFWQKIQTMSWKAFLVNDSKSPLSRLLFYIQCEKMKRVHVAVGVILRNKQVFITRRANHLHQGGKWEFPGGKVENTESVEQALERELFEEVGISNLQTRPFLVIQHDYNDKQVLLETLLVEQFDGEPYGKEEQENKWVNIELLTELDFPEANVAIVDKILSL